MKSCFIRLLKVEIVTLFSLLFFAGCSSTAPNTNVIDAAFKKMDAKKKPALYIENMRSYALDNFNNLSTDEYKLIQTTTPKIHENKNTMEFSYIWYLPNNEGCLEVLTTPPPDPDPIAVFRRDRAYYPQHRLHRLQASGCRKRTNRNVRKDFFNHELHELHELHE